jgi:hypothetical protein
VFLFILLAKYIRLDISEPDAMSASAIHPLRGCRLVGDLTGGIRLSTDFVTFRKENETGEWRVEKAMKTAFAF